MKNLLTPERILHSVSIILSIFLIFYLVTYVSNARVRADCQMQIKAVLIDSVAVERRANSIEAQAMDNLLNSLLSPSPQDDRRALLLKYQEQRFEAQRLRANSPRLPDPIC